MSLKDALETPEEIQRKKAEHRRKVWDAIKKNSPEHAQFIESFTKIFGKPEQVIHECNGEVYDSNG